jgi:PAS domain-containing protein
MWGNMMRQPVTWRTTATVRYALSGALVGCSFLFLACWLDLTMQGLPVTAATIFQVYTHHLYWVISAAALLLGCLTGLGRRSRDRLARRNLELSTLTAALREREERFRLLSASSPIGIFQTDATGRVVYTNARWQEMAGLTAEESLGGGWSKAIHPEDRAGVLASWETTARTGDMARFAGC